MSTTKRRQLLTTSVAIVQYYQCMDLKKERECLEAGYTIQVPHAGDDWLLLVTLQPRDSHDDSGALKEGTRLAE